MATNQGDASQDDLTDEVFSVYFNAGGALALGGLVLATVVVLMVAHALIHG